MKPLALLAALLMLAACSKGGGSTTAAAAITPEVHTMFTQRCSPCHGESGHGDGPGSAALNPKPRNYTDAAWQKSVTDEQIKKTILYGGAAVGKSPLMPANPDLDGKPELDGLVAKVRSFNGK
jgi:mono/diheme cytochrome c family protein